MEIAGQEGVVGRAEPALARRIGRVVGWIVGLPAALDLARHPQIVRHREGVSVKSGAQPAAAEELAVPLHEGPAVLRRRFRA